MTAEAFERLEIVRRALERGLCSAGIRRDSEAVDTFQHALNELNLLKKILVGPPVESALLAGPASFRRRY